MLCCAVLCTSQAKGKELLALTDKLHACEAEVGQLRKAASTLQGQLESAHARVTQQAAALAAAHETHSALQVGLLRGWRLWILLCAMLNMVAAVSGGDLWLCKTCVQARFSS